MTDAAAPPHPVLACARSIAEAVKAVADVDPVFMATTDKRVALVELTRLADQVAELRGRVLACADDVAVDTAARNAAAWLGHHTRVGGLAARRWAAQAEALGRWARVGDEVRAGGVNGEQAAVITRALDRLPGDRDPRVRDACEDRLITEAAHSGPRQLEIIGRRLLDVLDPDHSDGAEAEALDEERDAARRTFLQWRRNGDGTTDFRGRVSDAVFARFQAYLESFTSPRHRSAHLQPHGDDHRDDAHGSESADQPTNQPTNQPTDQLTETAAQGPVEDRRSYDQRMGHAFGSFLEAVDPMRLPLHGSDATTIVVTLDYDTLREQLSGIGWIGDQPLTADQVRRLACQAKILPAVLGAESEVLDLGRTRRLASRGQRKALGLRHAHCQADGCDIPSTWCETHHRRPWSQGGSTNLDDLVLLCSFHHHRAHDYHYDTTYLPTGHVTFHRRT